MSSEDPMAKAEATFEAAVERRASLAEARAAFDAIEPFRPKGMFDPVVEQQQDPMEGLYADAVNCFKMALDALEGEQFQLAGSYVRVAKIKLDKAREGG